MKKEINMGLRGCFSIRLIDNPYAPWNVQNRTSFKSTDSKDCGNFPTEEAAEEYVRYGYYESEGVPCTIQ